MSDARALSFVVVCTANQCRSPLAAAVLQARVDERDLSVTVTVTSAGTSAGGQASGSPATPPTVTAARRLGLDLSRHRSRPLDARTVRDAELLIAMERRHVQEIVVSDPTAFGRTFTLKELVRRGEQVGARHDGEPLAAWLARVHDGRRAVEVLGVSAADDVADPTANRLVDHDTMAREMVELIDRLVVLVWG